MLRGDQDKGHRSKPDGGALKKVCRFYMEGACKYPASECTHIHDDFLCYDFWKFGKCSRSDCRDNHFIGEQPSAPSFKRREDIEAKFDKLAVSEPAQHAAPPKKNSSQGSRREAKTKDDDYDSQPHKGGGLSYPPGEGMSKLKVPRVNTETFKPSHKPVDMRVVVDVASVRRSVPLSVRDVYYAPCVFAKPGDDKLYDKLVQEIQHCHVPEVNLLKSWHGDSHWIADDSTGWKRDCPTFTSVVKRLQDFLGMTVNATRFNWYKDTSEWKPYHHDAAAVKPHMAKTQNFTAAVSFGATRDAAFEDAATKVVVSMPQPNGSVYCFSRDTNILWRHGILQEKAVRQEGRISIIAWGWVDQEEAD